MQIGETMQESGGVLRFEVPVGDQQVAAFISRSTCQARDATGEIARSLADFFLLHRTSLEAVVARKFRAGARNPVVVRACDLDGSEPGHVTAVARCR